jgi:hypothetical protein
MSCMILSSKVFQKLKELRHFSRKQKFWPEEAKHAPCLTEIAPRLYMAAARFSQAKNQTPCFEEIAARLILAAARFSSSAYKNLTVHHHFHSILPTFLYQTFPRLPIHEFLPSSSTLSLPKHHQTTIQPQIHQSKPLSFTVLHNFPKLHKTFLSPSSLTTNGLQPTKHPLKESHQPQAIHKQSQTPSCRIRTTRKRHSFHQ